MRRRQVYTGQALVDRTDGHSQSIFDRFLDKCVFAWHWLTRERSISDLLSRRQVLSYTVHSIEAGARNLLTYQHQRYMSDDEAASVVMTFDAGSSLTQQQ